MTIVDAACQRQFSPDGRWVAYQSQATDESADLPSRRFLAVSVLLNWSPGSGFQLGLELRRGRRPGPPSPHRHD